MALKQLLEQLCGELAIECPTIDREKGAMISIHPDYLLQIQDLDPGFSLQSKIEEVPIKKREEFYIYLMRANYLGQGTGGARIGIDANEKFLTLSLGFSYEMNYQTFKESIEDFVNYVAYWREETVKFKEA